MREQRECGGCGGNRFVDGPCGVCSNMHGTRSCPVCAGRGTVDARASREDAAADGATLLKVSHEIGDRFKIAREVVWASHYGYCINEGIWNERAYWALMAARAAFRAVPGLRG